jgi:ABC-type molybdate transport system substrate-binding protein
MKFILALKFCLTAVNSPGSAAEIKVISFGTVSPVLHELIPQYERQSGDTVKINLGNPAATLERPAQGDPADLVMVAGALWDQADNGRSRLRAPVKSWRSSRPRSPPEGLTG